MTISSPEVSVIKTDRFDHTGVASRCHLGHPNCSYVDGGSCWRIECTCELGECQACP